MSKNKLYNILIFLFFIFLILFRFNNAVDFNNFWGYDGGGHLEYLRVILEEDRLPDFSDTYIAWHEPGFYYLMAGAGKFVNFLAGENDFINFTAKMLQLLMSFWSVAIVWLVYKISKYFSKNQNVHLASAVTAGLASVMIETSNYLTNELLLTFFITLLLYYFITYAKQRWNAAKLFWFSIIAGLALLTKLSALILIFSVIIWMFYTAIYTRKSRWLWYAVIILAISSLIYAPWAVYKQKNIGSIFSINAYEKEFHEGEMNELNSDFFYRLNPQVFKNPFWMTSSNSFWAMIFADAFSDYYMISNNLDENNLMSDDLRLMTESGNYVTHAKYRLSVLLLCFSLFYIFLFVGGVLGLFWQAIKKQFKPSVNLLLLIFIFGSFLAVAFNVYSFPFLERGTLKASFILPVWLLLFIIGFSWLERVFQKFKVNFLWIPVWFIIVVWGTLSVMVNWI